MQIGKRHAKPTMLTCYVKTSSVDTDTWRSKHKMSCTGFPGMRFWEVAKLEIAQSASGLCPGFRRGPTSLPTIPGLLTPLVFLPYLL